MTPEEVGAEAIELLGNLLAETITELTEARRDWQQYVHEVEDERARADAAEAEVARLRKAVLGMAMQITDAIESTGCDEDELISEETGVVWVRVVYALHIGRAALDTVSVNESSSSTDGGNAHA